jgi:hypothetical protein
LIVIAKAFWGFGIAGLLALPRQGSQLQTLFKEAYERARNQAIDEAGLTPNAFPKECPWQLDEVL